MRYVLTLMFCLCLSQLFGQNEETLAWINSNLIEIEDANPDSVPTIFHNNVPEKFKEAQIFGFGEATHHGKEFFDLKAKFFKYLVEHQGVRTFIMEENYPAESGINEWISGGVGDKASIANNFTISPWNNLEVVNLLEWMRNFNHDKPEEDQIRFYGMDIQVVSNIDKEIRDHLKKYNIPVKEELLAVVDSCVNKKVNYEKETDWADIQIPKLEELESLLQDFKPEINSLSKERHSAVLRALHYLKSYTYYAQHSKSVVRDQKMFENVKWIIANKAKNGKAFIWAHNGHINKKGTPPFSSGWMNLGRYLKEEYKDNYYSVYFDFAIGEVSGFVVRKNKPNYWEIYELDKPSRKSYAQTLLHANKNIFFIDMKAAINGNANNFFTEPKKLMYLGGGGYMPNKKHMLFVKGKLPELCDGLIFVKKISVPTYTMEGI